MPVFLPTRSLSFPNTYGVLGGFGWAEELGPKASGHSRIPSEGVSRPLPFIP